jgi:hypothetical protein
VRTFVNRLSFYVFSAAALAAIPSAAGAQGFTPVPAGKVYSGSFITVTAPKSEGWYLLESSGRGMVFARPGLAPGENFAAQIVVFPLKPTSSPQEFEALIVGHASSDANTERFKTTEFSHEYSITRGYPCVRMHNVSIDKEAQVGGGKTEVLILENEHLYCRHPVRTDTGFAITYSYRGRAQYPQLRAEAQVFLEGVQAPPVTTASGAAER